MPRYRDTLGRFARRLLLEAPPQLELPPTPQ